MNISIAIVNVYPMTYFTSIDLTGFFICRTVNETIGEAELLKFSTNQIFWNHYLAARAGSQKEDCQIRFKKCKMSRTEIRNFLTSAI